MAVRRLLAVGLWLCVTASATAIVWAGTSSVAADLTDRPAPVVAHRDVVAALESNSSGPETTPGIATPNKASSAGPTSSVPPVVAAPAPAGPNVGPTGPSGPQGPPPAATPTTLATPPTTRPVSPPTTRPPLRPTATYSMAGGVVTVACNGGYFIELVSATPANGYTVDVAAGGPYYVEVHFVRAGQDDPIWAYCLGQPFRAYGGSPGKAPRPF